MVECSFMNYLVVGSSPVAVTQILGPFLSLAGTSVKYSFPLISSKYPFNLLKIRQNGFTLLIFSYFESLMYTYPT